MYNLSKLYYPLTAKPDETSEYLPVKALQPYIRCFWGTADMHTSDCAHFQNPAADMYPDPTRAGSQTGQEIIIPDSCMDIIWEWENGAEEASGIFCGINDEPFVSGQAGLGPHTSMFAVRFYFWSVHLFADDHLREVLNAHVHVEQYFAAFCRELSGRLPRTRSVAERISLAEAYLLHRLENKRRSHDGMMNAVYAMLKNKGAVSAGELEISSGVGSRQLERLFRENTGVSPKKAADLIRFQNVWREMLFSSQRPDCIQDIVFAYGYSHQSHMINNFKKYAGMTPREALKYAGR
ncbi:helix-turn-helix domain-containing protein [Paenibacillus sp. PK3_47]|uniref:helix-turn-helix domain-containing protein n=1 Tax=Paenibacillus sp. PK3_47 TaxID=2072642 RepID=UPI00201E44D2|nr:helix-turn-helix domain-containing protein [Paenibacillus sp. PK3_47]